MVSNGEHRFSEPHAGVGDLDQMFRKLLASKRQAPKLDDEFSESARSWSGNPDSPLRNAGTTLLSPVSHTSFRSHAVGSQSKSKLRSPTTTVRSASQPDLRSSTSASSSLKLTSPSFRKQSSFTVWSCTSPVEFKVYQYRFGQYVNESKTAVMTFQGDSGLEFDRAVVFRSCEKAWMKGIRPGWRANSVAGVVINPDNEDYVNLILKHFEGTGEKFSIKFTKGRTKFGTGVVQASKLEVEKEENLERLKKTFKFRGSIPRVECRGISLPQLEKVFDYAAEHCQKWKDVAPQSVYSGQTLNMEMLNFHHAATWIVQPTTEARDSAFVEHLTPYKQVPAWFVSHCWEAPFSQFMSCMREHHSLRNLPEDEHYWVSAFALQQQMLQHETSSDKHHTSTFKALNASQFNFLLILDPEARALQRTWCLYEASMCLGRGSASLDIAVCQRSKVEILTSGLTSVEEEMDRRSANSGIEAKAAREESFPLALAAKAMEVRIENSQSTSGEDVAHILNSIVGQNLDSEPLEEHSLYTETNRKLHSFFAQHFLLRAANRSDRESDAVQQLWAKISYAMQSDIWRKSIDVNVEGITTEGTPLLLQCFPPNVQEIKLRFRGSNITDPQLEEMVAVVAELPKMQNPPKGEGGQETKRKISCDFRNCENTDETDLPRFDPLKELGVEIDLDITQSEYANAEGDVTTKAILTAVQMNLVRAGLNMKQLQYRVVPAVPILAKALANEIDWRKRKAAAVALGNLGQSAFDALQDLRIASEDDMSEPVRRAAAAAFAQVSGGAKD